MAIPSGAGSTVAQPIVVTPQPDHLPPRVLIQASVPGATSITVYRTDPDGRTRPVRSASPAPATGGTIVVADYESWTDKPCTYRAVSESGASVVSAPVTLWISGPWLRHPASPSLSFSPVVKSLAGLNRPTREAVNLVMGRATPVIVPDGGRKELQGTLAVYTFDQSDVVRLLALTNAQVPLLFDSPFSWGWDITHSYLYLGSATIDNPAATGTSQTRIWNFPFWVVDPPAGPQQPERTYADLDAEQLTYTALNSSYASYLDMLAGTPS